MKKNITAAILTVFIAAASVLSMSGCGDNDSAATPDTAATTAATVTTATASSTAATTQPATEQPTTQQPSTAAATASTQPTTEKKSESSSSSSLSAGNNGSVSYDDNSYSNGDSNNNSGNSGSVSYDNNNYSNSSSNNNSGSSTKNSSSKSSSYSSKSSASSSSKKSSELTSTEILTDKNMKKICSAINTYFVDTYGMIYDPSLNTSNTGWFIGDIDNSGAAIGVVWTSTLDEQIDDQVNGFLNDFSGLAYPEDLEEFFKFEIRINCYYEFYTDEYGNTNSLIYFCYQ